MQQARDGSNSGKYTIKNSDVELKSFFKVSTGRNTKGNAALSSELNTAGFVNRDSGDGSPAPIKYKPKRTAINSAEARTKRGWMPKQYQSPFN
mmetsp:Transcript_31963/g.32229  ORF Transcript_31963/g.32229 Transcript_31963/m.32229 type:complete len:93 (-) Transcript_31963:715-993(-)